MNLIKYLYPKNINELNSINIEQLCNCILIFNLRFSEHNKFLIQYQQVLDDIEIAKATSFCFKEDMNRYIISRAFLRLLLSKLLNKSQRDIKFFYNAFGKPCIINENLKFNISHTKKTLLIAVAKSCEIGIDIEDKTKTVNFLEVAKVFFSNNDFKSLKSLRKEELAASFYRTWVRKEAYIKAVGTGFSKPYKKVDFFNANLKVFNDFAKSWQVCDIFDLNSEFSSLVYSVI